MNNNKPEIILDAKKATEIVIKIEKEKGSIINESPLKLQSFDTRAKWFKNLSIEYKQVDNGTTRRLTFENEEAKSIFLMKYL